MKFYWIRTIEYIHRIFETITISKGTLVPFQLILTFPAHTTFLKLTESSTTGSTSTRCKLNNNGHTMTFKLRDGITS